MILIGQYDSPYVRRVAIAMTLYGMDFEHRPWSTFGEGNLIEPFNPLRRVPTLILDDGSVIIESAYMLDWLDEQAGDRALIASSGDRRRQTLYYVALSTGFSDKAIALFYEKVLHKEKSQIWLDRCNTQIGAVLAVLEQARAAATTPWLFGDAMSHADIVLGCSLRHAREAHADSLDLSRWPALVAHSDACEQLDVFQKISQPFRGPADS